MRPNLDRALTTSQNRSFVPPPPRGAVAINPRGELMPSKAVRVAHFADQLATSKVSALQVLPAVVLATAADSKRRLCKQASGKQRSFGYKEQALNT
eukprot:5071876-Pleurochrysis_carterae.AAC.4